MELRHLRHFVAVADERHFSRAAQRVNVAQSSLSGSIRVLEAELGEALFTRDSRRVALTDAGRALLPAARRALAAAQEGRDAVAGVRGVLEGTLRVGAIQSFDGVDIAALVASFRRRHPGVLVELRHDSAPKLVARVATGKLDVAFVDHPVDVEAVVAHDLGFDRMVLAVPAGDPLARLPHVGLGDPALRERAFVDYRTDSALHARVDQACAAAGLDRRTACRCDTIAALVELVAADAGVALLPPGALRHAEDRVASVPVEPAVQRAMLAVTPARHAPSAAAEAFVAMLPQTAVAAARPARRTPARRRRS